MTETYEKLTRLSAEVGELLSTLPPSEAMLSPSEAMAVLLLTCGRLLAREGSSSLTPQTAWDYVCSEGSRLFFEWGFEDERAAGHLGTPPVAS